MTSAPGSRQMTNSLCPTNCQGRAEAADSLHETYGWADPERLPRDERFEDEVARLALPEIDVDAVVRLSRGNNPYVACMALAALAERDDVPPLGRLRRTSAPACSERSGALHLCGAGRACGAPGHRACLAQLDEEINWQYLAHFIGDRRAKGEVVSVETFSGQVPIRLVPTIEQLIDSYDDELGEGFRSAFDEWRGTTVDLDFLSQFARVWERPFDDPPTSWWRRELVEVMRDALSLKPPKSVLLVGDHGVERQR